MAHVRSETERMESKSAGRAATCTSNSMHSLTRAFGRQAHKKEEKHPANPAGQARNGFCSLFTIHAKTGRQSGRRTNKRTGWWMDGKTGRQAGRQASKRAYAHARTQASKKAGKQRSRFSKRWTKTNTNTSV